jgi:PEP-CTERM motif
MTRHLVRFGGATAIAAILLFRPAATDAAVLLPGNTVAPNILSGAAGTLIDSVIAPINAGTITAAVVQNALGTLDFYYQIVNNAGSGQTFTSNANLLFRSLTEVFATSVFYRTDNGGLGIFSSGNASATPGSAMRDPLGIVVTFGFGATQINPGETTRVLVIRTNATDYIPGFSFVGNPFVNGAITFGPSGAALAAVPEPASLALLSSAFAAAGYLARRRKRKEPMTAAV